jgi:ABC-type tungstate transport system permease subunit
MFLVQRVFTRPSADIAFYQLTIEFRDHFKAAYKDSGKTLSNTVTFSEDRLKQVISTMWTDEATWNAYREDPVCVEHFTARNAYNVANSIADERVTSAL